MSVPPELMQKMMQGGGQPPPPSMTPQPPGGPGAAAGGEPQPQGPAASPMSKPQDKRGLKAAAGVNLHIATNMCEEALPAFGSESEEGKKILQILKLLGSIVGKRDNGDLLPAEVLQLNKRLPQMGGGTAIQQQIAKMQQQAKPQPAPAAAT